MNIFKLRSIFVSLLAIIIIFSFGSILMRGFQFGVDFIGGTMVDFSAPNASIANIRGIINEFPISRATLQYIGHGKYSLRIPQDPSNLVDDTAILEPIKQRFESRIDGIVFGNIESIGPQVSKNLIRQSATGIVLACVSILLYLIIRFKWQFAASGLIVLLFDIVMCLGLISITAMEVNLTIIAALLTILGYCINDIVVIYDRIRSNSSDITDVPFNLISRSVNETFRRSIITSFVTLLSVLGIMLFTNLAIRNFAIVVAFGIIVGTIASIFVAPSILLLIGMPRFIKKEKKKHDPIFYAS